MSMQSSDSTETNVWRSSRGVQGLESSPAAAIVVRKARRTVSLSNRAPPQPVTLTEKYLRDIRNILGWLLILAAACAVITGIAFTVGAVHPHEAQVRQERAASNNSGGAAQGRRRALAARLALAAVIRHR
jgi:hypothetical protein